MTTMKHGLAVVLIALLSTTVACCSKKQPERPKVLAKINDYDLTLDDFETQLAEELELDKDFKLTRQAKKEFLEELIKKQLLIQEAKKMKLDTTPEFVHAIQRYWESTLIRSLIEIKGRQIAATIYVSEEEIEAQYKKMADQDPMVPPLSEIRDSIAEEIKGKKKTKKLEAWTEALKQKATIKIDDTLL
ncbi:MAG: SurA N-terminal domain-containing protein [Deltaproteobacteria bacterium]|nr:SurA N-terminal domain-containing protein [Deltaproteobacteria bacterium]